MNKETILSSTRNFGIDLLRIVSMLMVVVLHILGQGGVLQATKTLSPEYEVAWFLEILCYCAVNCYALISGYVGIDAGFKYSNIIYIWLQVVFYSAGIAGVFSIFSSFVSANAVLEGLLPITNNLYWYFTGYFCLFLFIPALNKLILALNKKQLNVLAITIFALFSMLQVFAKNEIFHTNKGYSALWLILLYLMGAIVKKNDLFKNIKSYVLVCVFFLACGTTWLEKFVVDNIKMLNANAEAKNILISYTSPTIVLAGLMLLTVFSRIDVGNIPKKIISYFAPLSFGVYLIHVQKQVWMLLIKNRFVEFAKLHWVFLPIVVLITALIIFFICVLIDSVRNKLFTLLKIKQHLQKAENKFLGKIW